MGGRIPPGMIAAAVEEAHEQNMTLNKGEGEVMAEANKVKNPYFLGAVKEA